MESAIIALAAALAIAISTIFPALGQGKVGAAAMESIARQPEAAGDHLWSADCFYDRRQYRLISGNRCLASPQRSVLER